MALSLVASSTLALAIAAVVSTFAVVDGVLLRPLPIEDAESVVNIVHTRRGEGGHYGVPYHSYMGWRDQSRSFEALTAARERLFIASSDANRESRERLEGTEVSPEFWRALGVAPILGRTLTLEDSRPEAPPVVVVSNSLWLTRFNANPDLENLELRLDDLVHSVVGVMPPARTDLWLEWRSLWTALRIDEARAREEIERGFSVIGRLAEGKTIEDAAADLDTIALRLEDEYPTYNRGWTAELHPIRWWIDGRVRTELLLLLLAVGLVLLIASANVGNLLLSQATSRARELAVRQALGANRALLVRQLLAEATSLALLGGLVGLGLAWLATKALRVVPGSRLPRLEEVALDPRVVLFCVAVSLLAGIVSGMVPALRLSHGSTLSLIAGGRSLTESSATRRWRSALIAFQVALALTVGVGALLLVRSVEKLEQVDPGWGVEGTLTARLELAEESHPDKEARIESYRDLLRRVEALPGIEEAALCGTRLPLLAGQGTFELFVEGQPRTQTPEIVTTAGYVSPGYFSALGVPLIEGRGFAPDATWENTEEAVVSESFAREFFPRERYPGGAIGRWVEWRSGDRATIVGVAGDVRQVQLEREPGLQVYLAWGTAPHSQILVARTETMPVSVAGPVRREIERWAPGTLVSEVRSGEEIVRRSYANRRFIMLLFGAFGALALMLGVLGVYAMVAHSTGMRCRETAIRLACGARTEQVVLQILGESMRPVWLGLIMGGIGGFALGRLLDSQLFGITSVDLASFLTAGLLLVVSAFFAAFLPARQVARIDPAISLRAD